MKFKLLDSPKQGIIVLIHGNSSSPNIFSNLNLDFKCLIPTLPGHQVENIQLGNSESFALKDLKSGLLNLIEKFDEPIFIVGNSLGGHLAIEIAEYVKKLVGLMIFGTPPVKKPINFDEAFNHVDALQTFLTENPSDEEIMLAANIAVFDNEKSELIFSDFKLANPKVRSSLAHDLSQGNWSNQYEIFKKLKCTKTIVSGDNDPSVNKAYLKSLIRDSGDNANYIEIVDCGHYPTHEQPVVMSKLINEMASKLLGAHL